MSEGIIYFALWIYWKQKERCSWKHEWKTYHLSQFYFSGTKFKIEMLKLPLIFSYFLIYYGSQLFLNINILFSILRLKKPFETETLNIFYQISKKGIWLCSKTISLWCCHVCLHKMNTLISVRHSYFSWLFCVLNHLFNYHYPFYGK